MAVRGNRRIAFWREKQFVGSFLAEEENYVLQKCVIKIDANKFEGNVTTKKWGGRRGIRPTRTACNVLSENEQVRNLRPGRRAGK